MNQKLFLGISGGINYSKLHNDTIDFDWGTRPVAGVFVNYKTYKNVYVKSAILYSAKGSNATSPYFKLVNSYIDFNLIPQYKLGEGFFIQSGISYSYALFSKKVMLEGVNGSGFKRVSAVDPVSEISAIIGTEFRLRKHINIAFNYFIPLSEAQTKNFQVTLNISLFNEEPKQQSVIPDRGQNARQQIHDLKEGTLLVRLRTSEPKINALLKMGETEKADKVRQEQKIENLKIVAAFKSNFNFCKTAFFYSNNSNNIRNKKFENIFLNDSLESDSSITIDTSKSLFIAEFGAIEQDTLKHFSYNSYESDGNWSVEKVKHYNGGPDFGFEALLIRDKNFVQLSRPFPHYSRIIFKSPKQQAKKPLLKMQEFIYKNMSYGQTVEVMNSRLQSFYIKSK